MTAPPIAGNAGTTRDRVRHHLGHIYPALTDELDELTNSVLEAAAVTGDDTGVSELPGADEVVLITYGDTFLGDGQQAQVHLQTLGEFWRESFADVFSTAHVLPFYPSSSDGGFSVVDYRLVDPALGDWSDIAALPSDELMVDLVCNHGSAQSEWFADFIADRQPGRNFYLTADPDDDLEMVTRPRTHPLLLPVETAAGTRHVWATFSHDQVDFDFTNPQVLIEFCSILGFYLSQGATRVRLDAIAYLWKRVGTTSIHLPETHQLIKLMRALVQARNPSALVITETNVPHAQNVAYFGEGDEAQVVYNFTLAPLIVWSVLSGNGDLLTRWLAQLEPAPDACTFLNFIASHDGIGLRPVEGLVSPEGLSSLIDAAAAVGGDCSTYSTPDGPRPYELNVSLADLLAGPDGATVNRFVVAHALMLAVQGIPAIYVHSMLASPGDVEMAKRTGHKRDINRSRLSLDQARAQIATGWRADVFTTLSELIRIRRTQGAFAPTSAQQVLDLGSSVVAIRRGSGTDQIVAIHNLTAEPTHLPTPEDLFPSTAKVYAARLHDLISDSPAQSDPVTGNLVLGPWQAVWLVVENL